MLDKGRYYMDKNMFAKHRQKFHMQSYFLPLTKRRNYYNKYTFDLYYHSVLITVDSFQQGCSRSCL